MLQEHLRSHSTSDLPRSPKSCWWGKDPGPTNERCCIFFLLDTQVRALVTPLRTSCVHLFSPILLLTHPKSDSDVHSRYSSQSPPKQLLMGAGAYSTQDLGLDSGTARERNVAAGAPGWLSGGTFPVGKWRCEFGV